MSYKPEESKLIAYLYDELSEKEKREVEEYLSGNDEAREELDELKTTRSLLSGIKDKEVDVPSFSFNNGSKVVVDQGITFNFWKKSLAIAASIALILFIGYLTEVRVTVGGEGFEMAFGDSSNSYDEQQVEQMIANAIARNNQEISNDLTNTRASLMEVVNENHQQLKTQLVDQNSYSGVDEKLSDQKREFLQLFKQMLENSELDQKKYTDEVITDFAIYLDIQRQNDLEVIQTRFDNLKDNTELNQIQTNEILANLISTVEQPSLDQY